MALDPVDCIREYIRKTNNIREETRTLLISLVRPFKSDPVYCWSLVENCDEPDGN